MLSDKWDRPYPREQVRCSAICNLQLMPAALTCSVLQWGVAVGWLARVLARLLWRHASPATAVHLKPPNISPTPLLLQAAYPLPWVRAAKFWPTTSRVDNVYGDRHLVLRWPQQTAAAGGAEQEAQAAVA